MIEIARVTRVMKGGKRMRFRATVVLGDRKGRVGMGMAKGADVTIAAQKAFNKGKKSIIRVPIVNGSIPHEVRMKFGAASILLKPAPPGSGIKAGGAVRVVLELAGYTDAIGKMFGGNNKINNVVAALMALKAFKPVMKKNVKKEAVVEKVEEKNNLA